MKYLLMIVLCLCSCKKIFDQRPEQGQLFSIDSSGLVPIPGIDTSVKAGEYASKNNYIEAPAPSVGLTESKADESPEVVNRRCGLREGMRIAMALSYYAEQTTGQLSGTVVACDSMSGRVPKSIQWQPGELCFLPQENTTKQLVLAPGHDHYNSAGGSLFSLTEYCKVSTNFFLALQPTDAKRASNEIADQTYKGIAAAKGSVSVELAGLSFRYGSPNNMVVKHVEKQGGFALESDSTGGLVNVYFNGQASAAGVEKGFGGMTFDEKGNTHSQENAVDPADTAPTPEALGLYQSPIGRPEVKLDGGAMQLFLE